MTAEEVRQWAESKGLPDSWMVNKENESEPRPEPMTLALAEALLTPDWRVAILNVKHVDIEPQKWITLVYREPEAPKPQPKITIPKVDTPPPIEEPKNFNAGPTSVVMTVFGALLLIPGGLMVLDGAQATVAESHLVEQSAIRGIENVAEYGLGFVILALGLILCAIAALLRKK